MTKLALLGGAPVRRKKFPSYQNFDDQELGAAQRVVKSGIMSRFLGSWHPDFFGGPEVQAFEKEAAAAFGAEHAVSVNSASSGLVCALGAADLNPGDEVIVSPFSMSVSATAPLVWNAIPVFADIDPQTFNLLPASVEACITPRTKAIVVVHLFGQPADLDAIGAIAARHGLTVIEDCAQSPYAVYRDRPVGTLADIGVFSLNYHKHIHTGEGGVVTTNDPSLCERIQLIRNHAEAVVEAKGISNLSNMLGFNFRLGEVEAAIGRIQLVKGRSLVEERIANVQYLEAHLDNLGGFSPAPVESENRHVYYVHPFLYDESRLGVSRELFVKAVSAELEVTDGREAEGVLLRSGYVKPLYLLPLFQNRQCYGTSHYPFEGAGNDGAQKYAPGLCPNCEDAWRNTLVFHEMMLPGMEEQDLDDVVAAFKKVYENLDDLKAEQTAG